MKPRRLAHGSEGGVMRCCTPSEAMIEPSIRSGRRTEAGTKYGPKRELNPDECLMDGCKRKPKDGDALCRGCAKQYRRECQICGHKISDEADRKTNGKLCMKCHYRHTKPGKNERAQLARYKRMAEKIKRERP